ncbi:MAG: hypothetical protein CMN32_00010 [Saprospirales bacterium]|nr:hypothetical protein [Saprospirales bacterium]
MFAVSLLMSGLLSIAAGLFAYNLVKKGDDLKAVQNKLGETEKVGEVVKEQYRGVLATMVLLREQNENLRSIIDKRDEAIELQNLELTRLFNVDERLKKTLNENEYLTNKLASYEGVIAVERSRVDSLSEENELLMIDNRKLFDLYLSKGIDIAMLEQKIDELKTENARLRRLVKIASVVKVVDIRATGIRLRNSGKAVAEHRANRVESLRVCFTLRYNKLLPAEKEVFFIRLVNPIGETLAVEQLGSGSLLPEGATEPVRYTMALTKKLDGDVQQACISWPAGAGLMAGKYQIEIYNKDFLVGRSELTLD